MLNRITLLLSFLSLCTYSCSERALLTDQEIRWLKDNPDLKVSVLGYTNTYQFENNQGDIEGVFIDYLELIEKKINYKFTRVKYVELPPLFEDVKNKKIDVVLAFQETKERLTYLSFYNNLFESEYVIITRVENVEEITFNTLPEKDILLPKGHAIKDLLLEKFPDLKISFFESEVEALTALNNGIGDVFVGPKSIAYHFIKNRNLTNLRVGKATPLKFQSKLAVQKSKPILNNIISKAINSISIKERNVIFNKWLLKKNQPIYYKPNFWFSVLTFLGAFMIIIMIFNWRLKKKVKKRTIELELALEETRKSNNVKNKFLQNISHEIRTPMNGILGYSELLRKKNITQKEHTEFVDTIIHSGKKLVHIVDNILEISNLQTKPNSLKNESTSLTKIFETTINLYKSEASKKGIDIVLETPKEIVDTLIVDRSRLIKVLNNLISNAVKYTHQGSVNISYLTYQNTLEIKVKDTGIGIESRVQDLIFESFSNIENESSQNLNDGLGIGLSIVKENIRIMNGEISFISEKNKGTTFSISLPFSAIDVNQMTSQIQLEEIKNRTYKILVAEDEEINFLLVNSILTHYEAYNFIIIRAENGQEAVTLCYQNNDISIILMDIRMPIMDGYEATRIIKNLKPYVPVIVHTAYSTDKDIKNAYDAGCDAVISKPINLNEFKKVIDTYMSKIHS
ncbi:hybrid sensor histidine kinase/response regulator [Aquimarina pacifica]|uniref:hybrid sensor histidine kinase/response regulator n=1 Tax=Aquimarina pacifica TaxID=1296415 RepID=UPI0004B371AC|nr:transporter substrate-binding domain-containing protein [Aquimarina pacifica]